MKIEVIYNIYKDQRNYIRELYRVNTNRYGNTSTKESFLQYLDTELSLELKNANTEESANKVLNEYLIIYEKNNEELIQNKKQKLQESWERSGEQIIYTLKNFYKREIPFSNVTAYLTTIPICPYSYEDRSFYVYLKSATQLQMDTILHELNHFMFHNYFTDLLKELTHDQFHLLKESLTFFTNPTEEGYNGTASLRKLYGSKQWNSVEEIVEAGKQLISESATVGQAVNEL